jgi:hypothetical protein
LRLAQQGSNVAFAAKAAFGQLADGYLLRLSGGGLPESLVLMQTV